MEQFIVKGLVRLADRVRQELGCPISPRRLAELRRLVEQNVAELGQALAGCGLTAQAMPAPTRRAYLFLAGLDWDAVNVRLQEQDPAAPPAGSIRFPGLEAHIQAVTGRLCNAPPAEREALYANVVQASRLVEEDSADLQPHQLVPRARAVRGWLAYFAERENFQRYVESMAPAREAVEQAAGRAGKAFAPPAVVRFLPQAGIYRVRFVRDRIVVDFAAAMVCLQRADWPELAGRMFGRSNGMSAYLERIVQRDQYQDGLAELEAGGGLAEQVRGLHHDLLASFERVNAEYFAGNLARPRLTWSRIFTRRKLGHYDRARDTVMISSSLDAASVPACAVDFVMYHELLHKAGDMGGTGERRVIHNSEFERLERRFKLYDQAKAAIAKLP